VLKPCINAECKDGWLYQQDLRSCYKGFSSPPLSFDEAILNCNTYDAQLTTIIGSHEHSFLKGKLNKNCKTNLFWSRENKITTAS